MDAGLFIQPIDPPGNNIAYTYQRTFEAIQFAENLGFSEVWLGEHHSGGWENIPAPELFLAAAAERTKRIMLGPAVIPPPLHNPVQVAERMAMLDQMTFGRTQLALGPAIIPTDSRLYSVDRTKMYEQTNEALDLILQLYRTDGPITFDGEFYNVNDGEIQVRPYQTPHMPIAMPGSASGNAFRQAGKYGLIPISPFIYTGQALQAHWEIVEQAAAAHGNPPPDRADWRINRCVYVAETDGEAFDDIRRRADEVYGEYYFALSGLDALYKDYPDEPNSAITLERMAERSDWIIGSPATCRDKLEEFSKDCGGFGTILITCEWFAPTDKVYRSWELFASEVQPHFQPQAAWTRRSADLWHRVKAETEMPDFAAAAKS